MEDINTNKTNIVCNVHKIKNTDNIYLVKKNKIGNSDDLIGSDHPIHCNDGKNRVFTHDLNYEKVWKGEYQLLYTIQYEDEGTFYANDVMVDSLSPNHQFVKLSENKYINKKKYDSTKIVYNEDDEFRNKPKMTNICYNIVTTHSMFDLK